MKIAIDATRAVTEGAGLGRYTQELVKNLIKIDSQNEYVLIFTHYKTDETREKRLAQITQNGKIQHRRIPIRNIIKEPFSRLGINFYKGALKDCDLMFAPTPFELNFGLKIPQVITIHDLIPCLYPEQLGEKRSKQLCKWGMQAAKKSVKIIADSTATKKDIQKIYGIDSKKIEVIYLGPKEFSSTDKASAELKSGEYILTTGTVEPRKNLTGLFKAYAQLNEDIRNRYPLVVAGTYGQKTGKIFETIQNLHLENNVKFLGYVSDEELSYLYKNCLFFAFVSIYEGFGLPILEALSAGKAVLTSKVSSMPEVAGDAGVLINPDDIESIGKGLKTLIEDGKLRDQLERNALLQAKKFSWEQCAEQTLKVFEEVYENSH